MFRRLQFTIPEGAIFISCVDQKLWTLEEIMDPSMVIPLLANQDLTPMLFERSLSTICTSRVEAYLKGANSRIYGIWGVQSQSII